MGNFMDKVKLWFGDKLEAIKEWWDKTGVTGAAYLGVAVLAFFGLKVYWIASASFALFVYINWNVIRKIIKK